MKPSSSTRSVTPSTRSGTPVAEKLGRRERRRAEIRDRLYQAALKLFMSRGIQATTVKDITEAADLGKGTFFNYFPTKEHILAVFYEQQLVRADEALRAAHEGRESMQAILRNLIQRSSEEPSASAAMVRSFLLAILGNPAVSDIVLRLLQLRREKMTELFTIGQRRGVIRRDWRASDLARVSQDMSFGTALFWALQPVTPLNELLEANLDLFWSPSAIGLAVPARKFKRIAKSG
jgi:AcrR family transcriptional regulator